MTPMRTKVERSVTWQISMIVSNGHNSYANWQLCRKHRSEDHFDHQISVSPYVRVVVKQTVQLTKFMRFIVFIMMLWALTGVLPSFPWDWWFTWRFIRDMAVNERKNWKRREENGLGASVDKLMVVGRERDIIRIAMIPRGKVQFGERTATWHRITLGLLIFILDRTTRKDQNCNDKKIYQKRIWTRLIGDYRLSLKLSFFPLPYSVR